MIAAYFSGTTTLERTTLFVILSLIFRAGETILKHCTAVRVRSCVKSHATEKFPCSIAASKMISRRSKVLSSSCRNLTRKIFLDFIHLVLKEVPVKSIKVPKWAVYMQSKIREYLKNIKIGGGSTAARAAAAGPRSWERWET